MADRQAVAGNVAKLDKPKSEKPFTLKDYLNRRLDPPTRWRDVMVVFAGVFGHPAGQAEIDFRPSVEQALFLSNDPLIRRWLDPSAGGLMTELLANGNTHRDTNGNENGNDNRNGNENEKANGNANISTDEASVDEIFLSFLSRLPDAEERGLAVEWLRANGDRSAALRDLCLALICSAEFRFI